MPVAAAWIANGWIFSERAEQNGKFWINGDRIWGPQGATDLDTRYWIQKGWIWGPIGAPDTTTGFWIQEDWIWGQEAKLPFST